MTVPCEPDGNLFSFDPLSSGTSRVQCHNVGLREDVCVTAVGLAGSEARLV